MRLTRVVTVVAACLLLVGSSYAAGQLAQVDRDFIDKAVSDGLAEIQIGQLVQQSALRQDVKNLGAQLVQDHQKLNGDLKAILDQKGIVMPNRILGDEKSRIDQLAKLSGQKFDKVFLKDVVKDHEKAIKLFDKQARIGKDMDLKNFAARTLPGLRHHLEMARNVESGKMMHGQGTVGAPQVEYNQHQHNY